MSDPLQQRLLEAVIRVEAMGPDISEMKTSMRDMAQAITHLAVFEERQIHDRQALGRAFEQIEGHDGRIRTLELAQPIQQMTSDWVRKVVWLVMAAVMSSVLTWVLIARNETIVRTSTKTTTEVQR